MSRHTTTWSDIALELLQPTRDKSICLSMFWALTACGDTTSKQSQDVIKNVFPILIFTSSLTLQPLGCHIAEQTLQTLLNWPEVTITVTSCKRFLSISSSCKLFCCDKTSEQTCRQSNFSVSCETLSRTNGVPRVQPFLTLRGGDAFIFHVSFPLLMCGEIFLAGLFSTTRNVKRKCSEDENLISKFSACRHAQWIYDSRKTENNQRKSRSNISRHPSRKFLSTLCKCFFFLNFTRNLFFFTNFRLRLVAR